MSAFVSPSMSNHSGFGQTNIGSCNPSKKSSQSGSQFGQSNIASTGPFAKNSQFGSQSGFRQTDIDSTNPSKKSSQSGSQFGQSNIASASPLVKSSQQLSSQSGFGQTNLASTSPFMPNDLVFSSGSSLFFGGTQNSALMPNHLGSSSGSSLFGGLPTGGSAAAPTFASPWLGGSPQFDQMSFTGSFGSEFGQTNFASTSPSSGSSIFVGTLNSASTSPSMPIHFGSSSGSSIFVGTPNSASTSHFTPNRYGYSSGSSVFGGTPNSASTSPFMPNHFGSSSRSSLFGGTPTGVSPAAPTFGSPSFGGSSLFEQKANFGSNESSPSQTSSFRSTPTSTVSSFGSFIPLESSTTSPVLGVATSQAFGNSTSPAFGVLDCPATTLSSPPSFDLTATPESGLPSSPLFGPSSSPLFTPTSGSFYVTPSPFEFGPKPSFVQPAHTIGSTELGTTPSLFNTQTLPFGTHTSTQTGGLKSTVQPEPGFSFLPLTPQSTSNFTSANFKPTVVTPVSNSVFSSPSYTSPSVPSIFAPPRLCPSTSFSIPSPVVSEIERSNSSLCRGSGFRNSSPSGFPINNHYCCCCGRSNGLPFYVTEPLQVISSFPVKNFSPTQPESSSRILPVQNTTTQLFSTQSNVEQKGSRVAKYASTFWGEGQGVIHSVSGMPVYGDKSHEELRWEDYQMGDKGGPNSIVQPAQTTSNLTSTSKPTLFTPVTDSPSNTSLFFTHNFNSSTSPFDPLSSLTSSISAPVVSGVKDSKPSGFLGSEFSNSGLSVLTINNQCYFVQKIPSSFALAQQTSGAFVFNNFNNQTQAESSMNLDNTSSTPIQTANGQLSLTQSNVDMHPAPMTNHFGFLRGISGMPVAEKPTPIAASPFPNPTCMSQSKIGLPVKKSSLKSDYRSKVLFSVEDEDSHISLKSNSIFRPWEEQPILNVVHDSTNENASPDRECRCKSSSKFTAHKEDVNIKSLLPKIYHSDYYTEPRIQVLAMKEKANPGFCRQVKNFTVGRHGYGYINFEGETDVRSLDLESIIEFNHHEVIVYKGNNSKPLVGHGLNKPAEVTLLNVKCIDKKTGEHYTQGSKAEKYSEMVRKKTEEAGAEFVSYDAVKGVWKFRVKHF